MSPYERISMTVSHEIKSQLAKLLATEDLVVENKNVETAYFNVHTRVLTLPNWNTSANVYDLLVGHEVGHALYTPDVDWFKDHKIPPQFVNVVEDARIEKLMKRKYPGLSKTFWKGYGQLHDEDFFRIEDEDLATLNLADRLNLHFKIGNHVDVPFHSDEENVFVQRLANAETFEDVLKISKDLYEYCMKQKEEQENKVTFDQHPMESPDGGQDSEESEENEMQSTSNQLGDGENESSDDSEPEQLTAPTGGAGDMADLDVQTMSAFDEAVKDLADDASYENVYAELPKLNLKHVIISNSEIHKVCEQQWTNCEIIESQPENPFEKVDQEFYDFKRSAQKEVNYLVKEFECRKSASAYARASTARTGILDCTKLHTYKYNEDLFKKVTTLADGKNHGLVFVLDWSGSMSHVMTDTVKQLFNLVWFCKKVGIPFDVYAFTNDYPRNDGTGITELSYEKRDGLVQVREYFSMMNMLTSSTKGHELEKQMIHLWRLAKYFSSSWGVNYLCPVGLSLSGTPLNEALVSLTQIIPNFKSDKNVEKVQCVILTDGEAPPLKYHKLFERLGQYDEPFIGTNGLGRNAFIRDRKTGRTYSLDVAWYNQTNILLRILRDRMPSVNFVGIRVLAPRDAAPFIRQYAGAPSDYEKMHKTWKKEKSFTIKNSGYHKYFGLSSAAMSQDSEFDVKEDATKGQIKTAFVKSLRSKKMNKKVLGEFIELIA